MQDITSLVGCGIKILENYGQKPDSIVNAKYRSFKPITDFYAMKSAEYYDNDLMEELRKQYEEQYSTSQISRNVYNLRIRGIRIINEIAETGSFEWKMYPSRLVPPLSAGFAAIVIDFMNSALTKLKRVRNYESIVERFFLSLQEQGIFSLDCITADSVQKFLIGISTSRLKSMDDVLTALRKLDCFLLEKGFISGSLALCFIATGKRERKIHPGIPAKDIEQTLKAIDRSKPIGKRNYAILMIASSTGLRACDIVAMKLTDIDWRKNEISISQGKTSKSLTLPLNKSAGTAIADYILNGRPKSPEPNIFLRSQAPYIKLKDGVSVDCMLRRCMKYAEIEYVTGDGKTFHGIRRMLGKGMAENDVPITTVAQVLGHTNCMKATKQYIAIDIVHLRECALGFDSLRKRSTLC